MRVYRFESEDYEQTKFVIAESWAEAHAKLSAAHPDYEITEQHDESKKAEVIV